MKNTTKKLALLLLGAAAGGNSAWAQAQAIWLEPGIAVTFTNESTAVATSGSVSYQWYRNGNAIAGATSATYNLPASQAQGVNVEFRRGATSASCQGYNYSNTITITFCKTLTIGNICWATVNVDSYQQFASIPDMYTKFFQWNKNTAYAAEGGISNWNATANTSVDWTNNPCPTGWRLPTQSEISALYSSSVNGVNSWAAQGSTRGNSVMGSFFGPKSTTCTLPNNMTDCIFLPACGARDASGALFGQGGDMHYWTSTNGDNTQGYRLWNSTAIFYIAILNKAYALSVRCVQ